MNTLQKFLSGAVIVAVILSVFAIARTPQVTEVVKNFGAVATLDGVDNPYTSVNGDRIYYANNSIIASSTRLCIQKNPFNATSTISKISVLITGTGMAGANNYSISTSTTGYATSTPAMVFDHTIPANSSNSMVWYPNATTTPNTLKVLSGAADGSSNIIILPNEYLVVALSTSTGAGALTTYYTGSCKETWEAL